jgi:thiopeptide-type bacteriocin biosynthesis protein
MTNQWISTHIYFNDFSEMDEFILAFIHPLVDQMRQEGLVRKYFFIRYHDNSGIHIRFRINQPDPEIQHFLRISIPKLLSEHFDRFPLEVGQGASSFRLPQSCHFESYEPEYNRYGGKKGVRISEKHFQDSSDMAIRIIKNGIRSPADKALLAIQSVLSLALAAGLRDLFIARYFDILFASQSEDLNLFYDQNRGVFKETVTKTLSVLNCTSMSSDSLGLAEWFLDSQTVFRQFRKLLNLHSNERDFMSYGKSFFPRFKELQDVHSEHNIYFMLLALLTSYSHMTFNRVGFLGEAERKFYGVISMALKDIQNG